MSLKTILISLTLTWTAYDLNLFRRRRNTMSAVHSATALNKDAHDLREQKQIKREYRNIIPSGLHTQSTTVKSKVNYFSTRSRDARYSDQRKIRRRINNM